MASGSSLSRATFLVLAWILIVDNPSIVAGWSSSRTAASPVLHGTKFARTRIRPPLRAAQSSSPVEEDANEEVVDMGFLKSELQKYLETRKTAGADELAEAEVGKVIGGTRGNPLLEYVSGSPNKPTVVESSPNVFDYSELTKYGYSHLATPIMKAGGRLAMYDLLEMERPAIVSKPKPKSAPKLVIDRTGETDAGRYSGLKLGQAMDDEQQGQALEDALRRSRAGERLKPKIAEEDYEQPFADKRNVGPQQTPDWTASEVDEYLKIRGKSVDWSRRAKEEKREADPLETLDLGLPQRAYSILTGLLVAAAFGKSTPLFLTQILAQDESAVSGTIGVLRAPAAAALLAAVGSSVYCFLSSGQKQRSATVWAVKGLLGGPLTVRQLADAPMAAVIEEESNP